MPLVVIVIGALAGVLVAGAVAVLVPRGVSVGTKASAGLGALVIIGATALLTTSDIALGLGAGFATLLFSEPLVAERLKTRDRIWCAALIARAPP